MTTLARLRLIGMAGATAGFVALALWFAGARNVVGGMVPATADPASRLAFAARWLLAPGLTLLVGVWAAARRGLYADAIGGTRTPANHGLEINLRYNQNTVEQVVLAGIAWSALAVTLSEERLYLIPALAAAFVVGRATFWIGYLLHPMGRAFGMTVTMIPTIAAYGWLAWRAVGGRA